MSCCLASGIAVDKRHISKRKTDKKLDENLTRGGLLDLSPHDHCATSGLQKIDFTTAVTFHLVHELSRGQPHKHTQSGSIRTKEGVDFMLLIGISKQNPLHKLPTNVQSKMMEKNDVQKEKINLPNILVGLDMSIRGPNVAKIHAVVGHPWVGLQDVRGVRNFLDCKIKQGLDITREIIL